MSKQLTTAAAIAALLAGIAMSIPAAAQTAQPTIFTTTDFRQDKDRWTDPAYYRNNTPGQLRGMAINVEGRRTGQELSARVYGSQGTGRPTLPISRARIRTPTRGTTTRRCSSNSTAARSTRG